MKLTEKNMLQRCRQNIVREKKFRVKPWYFQQVFFGASDSFMEGPLITQPESYMINGDQYESRIKGEYKNALIKEKNSMITSQ